MTFDLREKRAMVAKILIGIITLGVCLMVFSWGAMLYFGNVIKTECARKIADGSLTEREKEICRRHGYL